MRMRSRYDPRHAIGRALQECNQVTPISVTFVGKRRVARIDELGLIKKLVSHQLLMDRNRARYPIVGNNERQSLGIRMERRVRRPA